MSFLLDLLYPISCISCGRSGNYLCSICSSNLKSLHTYPPKPDSSLDGYLPLFRHRLSIRLLIHGLKYQFASDLVPSLAGLMAQALTSDYPHLLQYWQDNNYVLVPIPLHWSRQNYRGFNQSEILADALSSLINLSTENILKRHKRTYSQVSQSSKLSRLSNIKSSFSMSSSPFLPSNIILLDDVITTGATVNQAASVLKSSGASSVWALSLAG